MVDLLGYVRNLDETKIFRNNISIKLDAIMLKPKNHT